MNYGKRNYEKDDFRKKMHLIRKRLLQNLHQAEAEEVLRREHPKRKSG